MEKTLAFKLATIGLLVALLMIALSMIGHLVAERRARRNEVVQDIATSSTEEQQITGPILVIPYEKTVRQRRENDRGERHLEEREVSGQLHFLPENFGLDGDVRTQLRARGIYEARLYHARLRIKADFDVPLRYGLGSDTGAYRFGGPFIAFGSVNNLAHFFRAGGFIDLIDCRRFSSSQISFQSNLHVSRRSRSAV